MSIQFQIFTSESEALTKNNNCDNLLNYPNINTKTNNYRTVIKKYDEDKWAVVINTELINACNSKTQEEKLNYYNETDLKTYDFLIQNDWFDTSWILLPT